MEILVTYDVNTETKAGRRRLRKVAKACEGYGQRVQKSVFECTLDSAKLELLFHRLRHLIDEEQDSLRFYRLQEPREKYVQAFGKKLAFDIHDPLLA
jgi:CRISPR-associated protein Cas2